VLANVEPVKTNRWLCCVLFSTPNEPRPHVHCNDFNLTAFLLGENFPKRISSLLLTPLDDFQETISRNVVSVQSPRNLQLFGIDLRGRLCKSRPTSNSFAESSSCQDNVVKRPPNVGRVASLNSKTLTCPLLSSANRSIARSDRSTSGNANWRNRLQPPPLSCVYKPRYPLLQVSKSNSRRGSRSAYR